MRLWLPCAIGVCPLRRVGSSPGRWDNTSHEDRRALDGGAEGLDVVDILLRRAAGWLRPKTGYGNGQGTDVVGRLSSWASGALTWCGVARSQLWLEVGSGQPQAVAA